MPMTLTVTFGCNEVSKPKSALSPVRMLIGLLPATVAFTSAEVGVGVGVGLTALVGVRVMVKDGVAVSVGVALGVTTFVAVAVAVLVGVGVLVGVFEGVSVKVGVTVGGSANGKSKMLPAVSINGDVVGSQPSDPSCNCTWNHAPSSLIPRILTLSPAASVLSGGYCEPGPCRTDNCRRMEAIGVAGVGVSVGISVLVAVGVCEGVTVGVFDGVLVMLGVAVGRSVRVADGVLVAVGSLVSVAVGAIVSVGLGVSEAETTIDVSLVAVLSIFVVGVLDAAGAEVSVGAGVVGVFDAPSVGVSDTDTTTTGDVLVALTALGVMSVAVGVPLPREANKAINAITTTAATTPITAMPPRLPPDCACAAPPS